MLNEKGPFAFDTTSAGSRVDSTLKMIGLKGEAISPVPLLSAQSSPLMPLSFTSSITETT